MVIMASFHCVATSYAWAVLDNVTWLLVPLYYLIAFRVNFGSTSFSFQYYV